MTITDFVDQLNAPGASSSFSALTSSSFPSLTEFNANTTSEALKWTDLEQNTVYQILSTRAVNTQHGQSVILSLQKAMWYANERVAAKPYDYGELTVICVVNWTKNKQDLKCTIHINCYSADYL